MTEFEALAAWRDFFVVMGAAAGKLLDANRPRIAALA